ncbi:helix-turn-helix domain-containing protein [Furfurilactobacillus rossiae]|uniref:HTH cro/C1-type domain-containing protein n=1 Tax=Furfurilactobacillus rossiae DSM 15814 TaxID=1114972 RepID=A0A0R1RGJ8_9LACO|nr:helix-turn-helix transcriptional regulator [Furfurilactobacillus rossiae]KRL54340.1 hypothetical protein FD35_GL002680 [Furfurilactobacillus rossiae DSM 15814]QFR66933.1 helix-turn-helix domain-containing protein [Furfurilactobacillus rossiae]QLE62430.1 hypothetical protein LROSRS0_2385 [Furfurilactobacillus rossiae]
MPIYPLRGWLAARKISQRQMAEVLHKDVSSVNRKLNGKSDWTSSEISKLHKAYGVPVTLFIDED